MSKTGDALLKLAQANPDITINDEHANHGAPGRLDSTEGNNCDPTHVNAPESPLEAKFSQLWVMLGGPELEREYRFEPMRRWRADFASPAHRLLVEIEGGLYNGGRHVRSGGYTSDAIKYNWATMMEPGWRVIRLTSAMLTPDYIESVIRWIQQESNSNGY